MSADDIQKLIDKYGQPAFDAAMRQVWVNLASDVLWIVIWVVVAIAIWKTGTVLVAKAKATDDYDRSLLDDALEVYRIHLRQGAEGVYVDAITLRLLVDEIDRLRRELALTRIVQQGERLGLEY